MIETTYQALARPYAVLIRIPAPGRPTWHPYVSRMRDDHRVLFDLAEEGCTLEGIETSARRAKTPTTTRRRR